MPEPDQLDPGLAAAREWLAGHGGAVGEDLGPPLEQGHCDECGALAGSRWQHGAFVLCLRCILRRRRAAVASGLELEGQGALPRPAELCPWIGDEPVPWEGEEPVEEEG